MNTVVTDIDFSKRQAHESVTVQAPGRINIIGEHTDYNDGFVLPAAIDKRLTVTMRRNGMANTANVHDRKRQKSFSFDLQSFAPMEKGWHNYVMGVVHELLELGAGIQGFDAEFEGNVPIGGGMSSSAALECSFAAALNELFVLDLDQWQLIKASQMAEHNFVGIKCGIMDQFASVMGKKDRVMLLDCRSLEFQYFPLELGDYQLLLLNTNVFHSLASSEYNLRRSECEEGVAFLKKTHLGITNLRDATLEQVASSKDIMPEHIFRRCHHVISENQRVLAATRVLLDGNHKALGQLMYQSHFSLQNDYDVSCPELDFLVQQTLEKDYVLGSRMMGGGFGGCTINIVEQIKSEEFVDQVSANYRSQFGFELTPIKVEIEDGAMKIG